MLTVVLRRINWVGLRRGMSGSRFWMALGVAAAGFRVLRWVIRNDDDILYRTVLKPGDRLEVVSKPRKP
jgi:hypothetical protein